MIVETWYGVFGPANLPAPVAAKLEEKLLAVVDDPKFKEKLTAQAISIRKMPSRGSRDFIAREGRNTGAWFPRPISA